MLIVQQIGELDVELRKIDMVNELYAENSQNLPNVDLTSHLTKSYLWVLGAYEIARTISQFSSKNDELFADPDKKKILQLKHEFARIRAPLAKFEPAKKYAGTDYMAMPAVTKGYGTAWAVNENTIIARGELADKFLDVYENVRHSMRGDFKGHTAS